MIRKVVLAYTGSLEDAALLKWIQEKHPVPVVAFVPDLGQPEDAGAISRKATKAGADKVVIADLRDEFARDYVYTALKANALRDGAGPLGGALARPLVAKTQIRVAKSEGADAVASGAGADAAAFELAVRALAPELEALAPARSGEFKSRAELLAYAEKRGLAPDGAGPCSADANLMRAAYEGGPLEDPWAEPPAEIFRMTADPLRAPDAPETVDVEFADGVPAAINRESLAPAKLILKLNEIAGRHGVGRADVVESRFAGLKARTVYEAPGVHVLDLARRAVESLTLDGELARLRDGLAPTFAALVHGGLWFSPEMNGIRAFLEESRKGVSGAARVRLFKGSASVVGRKSPNSLYNPELAGVGTYASAHSADAGGFIRMSGLRLSINKSLRRGQSCPS